MPRGIQLPTSGKQIPSKLAILDVNTMGQEEPNEEPFYTSGVYEYHNRPRRDTAWSIAFALFLALTTVFGIYGATHM